MTLDYKEIGKNIRMQRCRKKLKQAELAEMIGVTAQHICHIETGKSMPSLPVLVAIANALDTDANYLLGQNLKNLRMDTLSNELAGVLASATEGQLTLCIELCRAVINANNTNI